VVGSVKNKSTRSGAYWYETITRLPFLRKRNGSFSTFSYDILNIVVMNISHTAKSLLIEFLYVVCKGEISRPQNKNKSHAPWNHAFQYIINTNKQ
jgi:hypothetical protein